MKLLPGCRRRNQQQKQSWTPHAAPLSGWEVIIENKQSNIAKADPVHYLGEITPLKFGT